MSVGGKKLNIRGITTPLLIVAASYGGHAPIAAAQGDTGAAAGPDQELAEIMVTANKRSQSIGDVGMSITAVSGASLQSLGITTPLELGQVVPGLTVQPSPLSSPVYTLRGVGFYEATLSAAPTVMVYQDEVAVPFSAETRGVALDVQRVEVLKGPQGTVFGSNTTGGAINYVANKPTDHFETGVDGTFGSFATLDATGYVSGPLSDSLKARLAVRVVDGGDWQQDYLNGKKLGLQRQRDMRLTVEWQPIDPLKMTLTATAWQDTGDTQVPQVVTDTCRGSTAGTCSPANPFEQNYRNFPLPPAGDSRAAAWGPSIWGQRPDRDDWYYLLSGRADYQLNDQMTLTSITAFSKFSTDSRQDFDGTPYAATDINSTGSIRTIAEELRLSGHAPGLNWIVGANYEDDDTFDQTLYATSQQATQAFFATGGPYGDASEAFAYQDVVSRAAFGNVEYNLTNALTAIGGVRYTETDRDFHGCSRDDGTNDFSPFWNAIFGLHLGPGDCFVLSPSYPNSPQTYDNTGPNALTGTLDEHNVSWNVGLNYKLDDGSLLYTRIAQGYKAGSFPNLQAASYTEYKPVKQEGLLAYEVGAKVPMFDRRVNLSVAGFYYDYKNKQLKGRSPDAIFGSLDALVQIPKSHVEGAEVALDAQPVRGVTLSVGATYIKTEITKYDDVTTFGGSPENFAGQKFPYSPPVTLFTDDEYAFNLSDRLGAFVGASLTYNSKTSAVLNNTNTTYIQADRLYDLPGYYLLNLRAGVQSPDHNWRIYLYGRNVTNQFYSTNVLNDVSTIVRYTGAPGTYGIGFDYKLH